MELHRVTPLAGLQLDASCSVHAARRWLVLLAMVFSVFMPMLDHLVLNVSLPTIQRAIFTVASALSGFSETTSQLIATRGLQGRMQ